MKKIHGHDQLSLIVPPRMGPTIGAMIVVIAATDIATPALSRGKMRNNSVCESGISGPPHRPCAIRQAISRSSVRDNPHKAEKKVKPNRQTTKDRIVPKRAASQPVSGTQIASATA